MALLAIHGKEAEYSKPGTGDQSLMASLSYPGLHVMDPTKDPPEDSMRSWPGIRITVALTTHDYSFCRKYQTKLFNYIFTTSALLS